MHIKKDDKVIVLTGKDKGKTGTVVKAMPKENKVIVSNVNVLKVHQKPRKAGEKGQIIDKTMPINASNVAKTEKKDKAPKKVAKAKPEAKTAKK
jgi:large subunit ribosomal protein L24